MSGATGDALPGMAGAGATRAAPDRRRSGVPGGALPRLRRAGGGVALAGMIVAGLAVAVGAASGPSFLVWSKGGWVEWIDGPLADLGPRLTAEAFGALLLLMGACYLGALAVAGALPARWALTGIVGLHLIFVLAPPLLSSDIYGYIGQLRLGAVHGVSPYDLPVAGLPSEPYAKTDFLPSRYGPAWVLGSYALAPLGIPGGVWALKLLTGLASLGIVALVWRGARRLGRPPVPAAVLVGLNPLLLVYGVGGGHNDLVMVLLAVAGVYATLVGRAGLGAAGVVVAMAIKSAAGLVLPFQVLGWSQRGGSDQRGGSGQRVRALAGAAAALALVTVVGLLVFGGGLANHLTGILAQQQEAHAHSVTGQLGILIGLGVRAPELRLAASAVLAAAVAILIVRTWRGADWVTSAGWATFAALLTTGWLVPWYIVWLLPLAALGESRALRIGALAVTAFMVATRLGYLLG